VINDGLELTRNDPFSSSPASAVFIVDLPREGVAFRRLHRDCPDGLPTDWIGGDIVIFQGHDDPTRRRTAPGTIVFCREVSRVS